MIVYDVISIVSGRCVITANDSRGDTFPQDYAPSSNELYRMIQDISGAFDSEVLSLDVVNENGQAILYICIDDEDFYDIFDDEFMDESFRRSRNYKFSESSIKKNRKHRRR